MGDLSKHFSAYEFRCRDGSEHAIDPTLIDMLEQLREHFGSPVVIASGYRSPAYNRKVGGARNSYHVRGMAADVIVVGVKPSDVQSWANKAYPMNGVGAYRTFTHLDCRPYRARWSG